MKILVLENQPSSELGGQELSLLDVCQGLAKRGHQIHLLFLKEGDLLERYKEFAVGLTRVGRYAIDRRRTLTSGVEWLGSIKTALRSRPDVIYTNQYHDTLFGGVLSRLKRRPFVCHLRLMPPDRMCGQHRIGTSLVTRFIANTDEVKRRYVSIGFPSERLDVVYNGIDLQKFSPAENGDARLRLRRDLGIPAEVFVVLYMGRIDPGKGIEVLLKAFARLPASAWLIVAGSPVVHESEVAGREYLSGLQALAEEQGVGDRVRWLGRRNDVPDVCRSSDVAVLPTEEEESFGRILIEAMACGIPAIGPRLGGVPEVLSGEFERLLSTPKDPEDLARVLVAVFDWRTCDPQLGRRCRAHVEQRFGLEAMAMGIDESLSRARGPT